MSVEITVDANTTKRPRGRPRKNGVIISAPVKHRGRPKGSKNKSKIAEIVAHAEERMIDPPQIKAESLAVETRQPTEQDAVKAELIKALHTLLTKVADIDFSCLTPNTKDSTNG